MKRHVFVIVGAGIAGLSTAFALKNIGIDAMVVEASETIRPVGAGLSLAHNAIKALRHLNIADEVIEKGRELKSFILYDRKGRVIKEVQAKPLDSDVKNVTIHRARLHEVLLSKIKPDNILTGKRSISLTETTDGFMITFEDGTAMEAQYLIVAEGIHSPLRKFVTSEAEVRFAGYTCWRGVTSNANLKIGRTSETWGKEGRFGIVPLADDQLYWFACTNTTQQNGMFKNYAPKDLVVHFKDYHQPIVEIIQSTPSENLIWGDISDVKPLQRFAYGNAVLIGDAAHATTPNMGQGACMAIEDAVVLANCLSQNSKVSDAFQSFERKRLTRTHSIVNDSWRLGKIAQMENGLLTLMRDKLFRLMPQHMYEQQMESIYNVNFD